METVSPFSYGYILGFTCVASRSVDYFDNSRCPSCYCHNSGTRNGRWDTGVAVNVPGARPTDCTTRGCPADPSEFVRVRPHYNADLHLPATYADYYTVGGVQFTSWLTFVAVCRLVIGYSECLLCWADGSRYTTT